MGAHSVCARRHISLSKFAYYHAFATSCYIFVRLCFMVALVLVIVVCWCQSIGSLFVGSQKKVTPCTLVGMFWEWLHADFFSKRKKTGSNLGVFGARLLDEEAMSSGEAKGMWCKWNPLEAEDGTNVYQTHANAFTIVNVFRFQLCFKVFDQYISIQIGDEDRWLPCFRNHPLMRHHEA